MSVMKSLKTDIGDVYKKEGTKCITDYLKVILKAWHFHSIVGFFVYGGMVRLRGSGAHTLMRRYVFWNLYNIEN